MMGIALFSPYLLSPSFSDNRRYAEFIHSWDMVIYSVLVITFGIFIRIKYGGFKDGEKKSRHQIRRDYRTIFISFSALLALIFAAMQLIR
jgi:hypothetical protein